MQGGDVVRDERVAAEPSVWAVETAMLRALAVLRFVVLTNTFAVNLLKWDQLARPGLTAVGLALLSAWSAVAAWAYDEPRRRHWPLLALDMVVGVGAVLFTTVSQSDEQLRNPATFPSFWVMSVVFAWAICWNWRGGLAGALLICAADLSIRDVVTATNVGNIFLLMIGGPMLGYCAGLLKEMSAARDRAERAAAAAAERQRLARAVHDGVLQVLSLVQRRGAEAGGELAELGRLAGEQEVALRALVQRDDQGGVAFPGARLAAPAPVADLAARLLVQAGPHVTVSVPGQPVQLPGHVVDELSAVVGAALDNVRRHVGADAPAWVLLEEVGGGVVVTVRDEGPGIPEGRLAQAEEEGRLGVAQSICGRVADLGGSARLVTAPGQGTEWELSVPTLSAGGRR